MELNEWQVQRFMDWASELECPECGDQHHHPLDYVAGELTAVIHCLACGAQSTVTMSAYEQERWLEYDPSDYLYDQAKDKGEV